MRTQSVVTTRLWLSNPRLTHAWHRRGNSLEQLGRHGEAIQSYDACLRGDQGFLDAWYRKGLCLGIVDRYREAIGCYDHVLALKPEVAYVWSSKASCLEKLKEYEHALSSYERAVELEPSHPRIGPIRGAVSRCSGVIGRRFNVMTQPSSAILVARLPGCANLKQRRPWTTSLAPSCRCVRT